jgi:hypothetical protein
MDGLFRPSVRTGVWVELALISDRGQLQSDCNRFDHLHSQAAGCSFVSSRAPLSQSRTRVFGKMLKIAVTAAAQDAVSNRAEETLTYSSLLCTTEHECPPQALFGALEQKYHLREKLFKKENS